MVYVSDVSSASVSRYRDFIQNPSISPVYVITCQHLALIWYHLNYKIV